MIQVESKPPDLERFPAALMLPGVDPRVELLQHLIVAREQGAIEHFGVAQIHAGLQRMRGDDDAFLPLRNLRKL